MNKALRFTLGLMIWTIIVSQSLAWGQVGNYDWEKAEELYPGVKRVHVAVSSPRVMNINCLQIDTKTRGLKFYTSPRYEPWVENTTETKRQRTRNFIRQSQSTDKKIVVAINCDAFSPWPAPWDQETLTNVLGLAVSEGKLVSPGSGEPSLIIAKDGTASMATTTPTTDISNIRTAVSGFGFVLTDGNVLVGDNSLHPRTGTGVSQDKRYVYFLTIDGRQPKKSEGSTTQEVGQWLKYYGAYNGINMDGGGSTTMAWWDPNAVGPDKATLLNVPVGGGPENSERANGNNIGVYYEHSSGSSSIKKALPWAIAAGLVLLVK